MNSKTYTILQSFDKYEVNRLRKFLQSPYFNMNEAIVELFEILIKDIFSKKKKGIEKEEIWAKIYKNKKYDDVRFRKLNSELLKLIEKFLAQQIYEENPIHQANHLIISVGNRKLEKLYSTTMKSARRLSDKQKFRPANYFYYQYEIEKNFYNLTQLDIQRSAKGNEDVIAENLDFFYLAEKLRIHCSMMSRQRESSHIYNTDLIDEVITVIEKNNRFLTIPPIAIYYRIYLTYLNPDDENNYFQLKKLLLTNSSIFPIDEINKIYVFALNYCVRKSNKGNPIFLREYFDLYCKLLEITYEYGELSPWDFKNIVLAALRLGEYEWTENFINVYSKKLPYEFRDNAVTFNSAQLYFYQKKYDNVIKLLHKVDYEDLAYNLNSKLMLIAVYYETDEIEPLYSLFESFRVYLNRNSKIPINRKKYYLNFIKITKKLTRIIPGDKKAIKKINEDLNKIQDIVNLKWLKEKIAELE